MERINDQFMLDDRGAVMNKRVVITGIGAAQAPSPPPAASRAPLIVSADKYDRSPALREIIRSTIARSGTRSSTTRTRAARGGRPASARLHSRRASYCSVIEPRVNTHRMLLRKPRCFRKESLMRHQVGGWASSLFNFGS